MMRWLIPVGLAATVAGLILYEKNKKQDPTKLRAIPNPGTYRATSPGQPQPPSYNQRARPGQ